MIFNKEILYDMNLQNIFDTHFLVTRYLCPNTRLTYSAYVKRFLNFLEIRQIEIQAVDIKVLITFFTTLPKSISSNRLMISALRKFGEVLVFEKIISENIFLILDLPRREKTLARVYEEDEVNAFLDCIDDSTIIGKRDKALFELIYSAGLRASEAGDVETASLHLYDKFLFVTGKGRKERMVCFGDICRNYLEEYLDYSRPFLLKNKNSKYLFVSTQQNKLNRNEIWYRFKKYRKKVGLRYGTVHTLRHSFATHLYQHGMGLENISLLLGHENLETTCIYTHLDGSYLREVHRKYFPGRPLDEDE